jgi:hypothetical protein
LALLSQLLIIGQNKPIVDGFSFRAKWPKGGHWPKLAFWEKIYLPWFIMIENQQVIFFETLKKSNRFQNKKTANSILTILSKNL